MMWPDIFLQTLFIITLANLILAQDRFYYANQLANGHRQFGRDNLPMIYKRPSRHHSLPGRRRSRPRHIESRPRHIESRPNVIPMIDKTRRPPFSDQFPQNRNQNDRFQEDTRLPYERHPQGRSTINRHPHRHPKKRHHRTNRLPKTKSFPEGRPIMKSRNRLPNIRHSEDISIARNRHSEDGPMTKTENSLNDIKENKNFHLCLPFDGPSIKNDIQDLHLLLTFLQNPSAKEEVSSRFHSFMVEIKKEVVLGGKLKIQILKHIQLFLADFVN